MAFTDINTKTENSHSLRFLQSFTVQHNHSCTLGDVQSH